MAGGRVPQSGADGDSARDMLEQNGIETIRVEWSDLHGLARGKRLSRGRFLEVLEEGMPQSTAPLFMDLRGETGAAGKRFEDAGWPDMLAVPDVATLRPVPYEPGTAVVTADLHGADGREMASAPRHVLRRVLDRLQERGWAFQVAAELEFYLFETEDHARLPPGKQALRTRLGREERRALSRMWTALADMGFGVEGSYAEDGPGQFEVNIRRADPLRSADEAFLFRNVVKEIAAQEGLLATFMAKPLANESGNGFHLHLGVDQDAAKHDLGDCGAVSQPSPNGPSSGSPRTEACRQCRAFVAGQLAFAGEAAAIYLPTVNSYKRILTRGPVPLHVNWSQDNRTAAVRLIRCPGEPIRVENRIAGADANPYLLIAVVLASGMLGVEAGLDPGDPLTGHVQHAADPGARLPGSLTAALPELKRSRALREWLGDEFVEDFVALKSQEAWRFEAAVTDWETDEYASYL